MVYPNSQEARKLIILDDSEKYVPNILTQHEYIYDKKETMLNILKRSTFLISANLPVFICILQRIGMMQIPSLKIIM